MAETIETKVAALRRFVADAAHELGTPLTALHTNLELVDDPQIASALEQVERMDALTRNLLDLSHLEAAGSDIQFENVDLAGLLRDLAEPYASRAEQVEISFNLDGGLKPVIIQGDAAQLRILIQNLLDNAIKFTQAGGQVNVNLSQQNDTVQLSVADTGIGIPEEDLPHLFSRFHRGSNAAAYPGSGLGLAIVKAIADRHGASLSVESDQTGSVFAVQFSRSN
jgi:signal transduction histidine kinase